MQVGGIRKDISVTQHALIDPILVRIMEGTSRIDSGLPTWARRSNPIVRRQLGIYWKTLPLELWQWVKVLLFQSALVLLAVPVPVLYSFIMPVVTVSIILVPIVIVSYAQVLFNVTNQSVTGIYEEQRNNTLQLLLITPVSLRHILFSKVAASIWRQMDNLSLAVMTHVLLTLPLLILHYASVFSPDDEPLLTALAIILALMSGMARLFLEPVMVGAIGVMIGACTSPRVLAVIVACALNGSYFLFINLPRLMPMSWSVRLVIEIGLPLVLPVVIAWLALSAAEAMLRRD
jgi:hypothetical protein